MPDRLLFGSCNSQMLAQPLWPTIVDRQAAAFCWGGDAVYGDWFDGKRFQAATPEKLAADYEWMLTSSEGYQSLIRQNVTIIGTWDDHDFGINNGDRTFPHKRETAQAFVDFIERSNPDQEKRTLLRQRADRGDGVYAVTVFDFARSHPVLSDEEAAIDAAFSSQAPLTLSDKSVAVYTIDVRSHKTPWNQNGVRTDYQGDFLGPKQWEWLETSLSRSTAAVNIVVSGLQVHTDRFVDGNVAEEWSRFPMAQHRLYQALLQPNVRAPLIVSGDVHMGELLRRDCQVVGDPTTLRPLVEMTTSGMTHSWGTSFCSRPTESNPICQFPYFQKALGLGMHWGHLNSAWRELLHDELTNRPQYTLELNFGEFEFDWEQQTLTTRLVGVGGVERIKRVWQMDALSGKVPLNSTMLRNDDFSEAHDTLRLLSGADEAILMNDYYCLPYRGPQTAMYKYFGFITSMSIPLVGFLLPIIIPLWILWRCLRACCRKHKSD